MVGLDLPAVIAFAIVASISLVFSTGFLFGAMWAGRKT